MSHVHVIPGLKQSRDASEPNGPDPGTALMLNAWIVGAGDGR